MQDDYELRPSQCKRKSKVTKPATQTLNLNIPLATSNAIVSSGLVHSRVNQLDGGSRSNGGSMIGTLKKQKRRTNTPNARLAVATSVSACRAPMKMLSMNYLGLAEWMESDSPLALMMV